MSRWQSYPAYKDSGVEWLGTIPSEWKVVPLKYACRESALYGANVPASEYTDEGVRFIRTSDIDDFGQLNPIDAVYVERAPVEEYLLEDGELLLSRSGTIGRSFLYSSSQHGECSFAGYLVGFKLRNSLLPRFAFYFTKCKQFQEWLSLSVISSTIGNVNAQKYANMPLPVPPLPEQRAIAAFLDREIAKIDALVAKQERLIALLQEKRAALISHAVTKGLDPDVPMKDSGIPSIGQIPAHWEVKRNKRIFEERNERSLTGEEELLSVSHITGVTPRSEKEVYMFMAESMEGYKLCHPGDLVINTMWAWMGALGITEYEGIVSPSYHVYKLTKEYAFQYVPKYLDLLYRTPAYVCEITRHSKGVWTSRLRLYPDSFFDMYTPTPPLAEQHQILAHITEQLQQMAALIDKSHRFIERLQEYRTALISAAVTGKIDVRNEVRRTSTQPGVALRHP